VTFFAGIDIGSATTKTVIVNDGKIVGVAIVPTGASSKNAAISSFEKALKNAGKERGEIKKIIATGYGRIKAEFADDSITEITCHAYGAKWLYAKAQAVIDIGGQDSKAILLDDKGGIKDFVMNDKCAAGTGRFIEMIARTLDVPLDEVGKLALKGKNPEQISNMCAVFAESEVISLIAEGKHPANILAGVHEAIARRVIAMAQRIGINDKIICFTGGVAQNIAMIRALEKELGRKIIAPKEAQIAGALGAALLAKNSGGSWQL
jgi:predicted CoA-substrate-specific enzyme activase